MIGSDNVTEIIKYIRTKAKMTQEQFAVCINTTPLTINRWENGKSIPNKMAQNQLYQFCKENQINLYNYIVEQFQYTHKNDGMILYHGSKEGIIGDIMPKSRRYCDFGRGFYMGTEPSQPLTLICDEKNPIVYSLTMDTSNLRILEMGMDLEWAMLIAYYRGYMDEVKDSKIYKYYSNLTKDYDIISGYIADDRMYQVITGFFEKRVTDVALVASLSALDLGKQYVAVSEKACRNIEIIGQKKLSTLELLVLKEQSIIRRSEGISLTEKILLEHRRDGKFFDEILRGE